MTDPYLSGWLAAREEAARVAEQAAESASREDCGNDHGEGIASTIRALKPPEGGEGEPFAGKPPEPERGAEQNTVPVESARPPMRAAGLPQGAEGSTGPQRGYESLAPTGTNPPKRYIGALAAPVTNPEPSCPSCAGGEELLGQAAAQLREDGRLTLADEIENHLGRAGRGE